MNIKGTYKSNDTEEWFDILFNRPLGYLWARFFALVGIHPNAVTLASMVLGAAAGIMFGFNADSPQGLLYNIIGIALLMLANIYDSADGQLARMTNQKTELGRILDGASADVWYIFIYTALSIRLQDDPLPVTLSLFGYEQIHWGIFSWLLCAVCGLICHTSQCRLADYYRNIHLYFIKAGNEFDRADEQARKYDEMPWKGHYVSKFFQWLYKHYTHAQESATPHFQMLWKHLQAKYGTDIPQEFCDEFRRRSLPLMKYTNFLTFNSRAITLYVTALFDCPWIYLLFEALVLSSVYYYMHYRHEKISRELLEDFHLSD